MSAPTGFSVYPNPATKEITFNVENFEAPYELLIYDLTGKQVFRRTVQNKIEIVNSRDISLSGGIYYYRAVYNGSLLDASKLIILNLGE
jgi:hypothetical protein